MAVYCYSRISDTESFTSRDEREQALRQEQLQLQTFALAQGLRLDQRCQDLEVKWNLRLAWRPEGERMLGCLRRGDTVIASSLPRIFSDCADLHETSLMLAGRGVRLLIIELGGDITDPAYRLPFDRVMKVFADLEKHRSRERIKSVKATQRRKGRFLGGSRPFGYMIHDNGRLIENPMEQRVLKKIIEMKNQGKSLRTISAEVSTPMMPISFKTVQRLLKRHNGEPVD